MRVRAGGVSSVIPHVKETFAWLSEGSENSGLRKLGGSVSICAFSPVPEDALCISVLENKLALSALLKGTACFQLRSDSYALCPPR